MLRIKGQVGSWPVDLSIELDSVDWANLASHLPQLVDAARSVEHTHQPAPDDSFWVQAQQLLAEQGSVEGPQLFAQLTRLVGSEQSAKRLLVRLRHCAQVRVDNRGDAPLYCWQG